ncbi:hypothetical protein ACFL2U_02265 [Patescibacteria group bacterium]
MKVFRLHWDGGKTEVVEGHNIADAFRRAGYGGGAINVLDWHEPIETTTMGQIAQELGADTTDVILWFNGVSFKKKRTKLGEGLHLMNRSEQKGEKWLMPTDEVAEFKQRFQEATA